MIVLCLCDLGLNSSVEFDDFAPTVGRKNILVLVFGLQLVVQISIFLTLFLMMGDTYLFRVGLLGVLSKQFPTVLFLHPFYITYTLLLGGYRVSEMHTNGVTISELWDLPYFIPLSVVHKIVAAAYYVANLRSTIKLGSPLYYNKDAWVNLYYNSNKNKGRIETGGAYSGGMTRRKR